eukprot:950733-Rhodomonas_salina.1
MHTTSSSSATECTAGTGGTERRVGGYQGGAVAYAGGLGAAAEWLLLVSYPPTRSCIVQFVRCLCACSAIPLRAAA